VRKQGRTLSRHRPALDGVTNAPEYWMRAFAAHGGN
jgi:hypothetical protein